jgi:hypothetical protein
MGLLSGKDPVSFCYRRKMRQARTPPPGEKRAIEGDQSGDIKKGGLPVALFSSAFTPTKAGTALLQSKTRAD